MTDSSPSTPARLPTWLWLLAVVLITLNLRPFLTAPGPLGHAIQTATGMGLRMFSWLTLLPMVLMGVGTWLAPTALRRLGVRPAIAWALVAIGLGCALRLAGANAWVLVATAGLCGAGVALVQGILPGLIKRQSPQRMAMMMGLYSAALMGGGALSAQLSPWAMQCGLGLASRAGHVGCARAGRTALGLVGAGTSSGSAGTCCAFGPPHACQ